MKAYLIKAIKNAPPLVKDAYYIVNKHENGFVWLDNHPGMFFPETRFEYDERCKRLNSNNKLTREEIKLMSKQRAIKNDQGKLDYSLIPKIAMDMEAKALMVGLKKYGRYNYCGGMELTRVMSALLRHAFAYLNGEELDPVDGQPHLGSIRACTSMLARMEELGTLIDDRYKKKEDTCPQQLELPLETLETTKSPASETSASDNKQVSQ